MKKQKLPFKYRIRRAIIALVIITIVCVVWVGCVAVMPQ